MTRRNPLVGDAFGRYRLDREIGRGGMGVVFLAQDMQLDRPVALKVISPDVGEDEQFRMRFAREMRIAAQVEHPNIVPVHEAGEIDGLLFIAMRYVTGEDLRSLLSRYRTLELPRAATLALQLGAALDAAHARGLVHRDVKPANILIGGTPDEPHVYLSDFGLAREAASDSGLTNTGQWMGTIDYVAPEQLDGGVVSARTDIYSMGCVLFEMVTGEVPFTGTIARKLYAHTHETLPSVGAAGGRFVGPLDDVLSRASAKNPEERYASAGDLGRAFAAATHGEGLLQERSVATGVALSGMATRKRPANERRTTAVMDASVTHERSDPPAPPQPAATGQPRSRLPLVAALVAALVIGAAVLAIVLHSNNKTTSAATRSGPVKVHITAPAPGSVIDANHVLLRGTVDPPNATVDVDGKQAAVGNGFFRADAVLQAGPNTIDVIAGVTGGAAPTSATVVVTRKAHPGTASAPTPPAGAGPGTTPPASPRFTSYTGRDFQTLVPTGAGWSSPLRSQPNKQRSRTTVLGPDGDFLIVDSTPTEPPRFGGSTSISTRTINQPAFGSATEYVFQHELQECSQLRCVDYILQDSNSPGGFAVLAGGRNFVLAQSVGRKAAETLTPIGG
jgi:serine/threonine-protein kinase